MFEYMMPALWMRTYPETLMSRTLKAVGEIQMAYGRRHRIPWGISESGFATQDGEGNYQYYAFGVPDLSLKGAPETGPVVSPYSSFLALSVAQSESHPQPSWHAGGGLVGRLGFYESADYSASLAKPALVREWMAHHQGMSLLSILNLLRENVVQDWFHANPSIQATELLLQEKPIRTSVVKAEHRKTREHALPTTQGWVRLLVWAANQDSLRLTGWLQVAQWQPGLKQSSRMGSIDGEHLACPPWIC